ncbi:hypothetical protein F2Q70_00020771 [Brassica cretica]|uniref:TIR domain-containing protein n=1 Tax=Brassica cretica TaxID=69181 RepID=A0A8S9GKI8_BRACR|nr:hypothetical protein F2Q70_00020771 [Brassica cretica]KAF2555440.1 hypothetical protein F2Q68_00014250 [Brassica cretica]
METEVISKPHKLKFDVFRSFRGEDTRHNFTERVYDALHKKRQSLVFHDDEGMQRGDEINQTRSPPWKTLQPSDGVTADKDTEVEEPEAHDRTRGCQTEEENQTQRVETTSMLFFFSI